MLFLAGLIELTTAIHGMAKLRLIFRRGQPPKAINDSLQQQDHGGFDTNNIT
jgi:hypothetical protein